MRKTPRIHQVDGSNISILCNALNVGLQSLPLVTLLFTFLDHWERMLLGSNNRDVLGMANGGTLSLTVVSLTPPF
jgi:hypothetical protein